MMDDRMDGITEKIAALEAAAKRPFQFCNKCGFSGYEGGERHNRPHDGSPCSYMAGATVSANPATILDVIAHIRALEAERDAAQAELKRLREQETVAWVPRPSLESLHSDGSHVAVRTAIHRAPLKSGNGAALYAHPVPAVSEWQPIETAPKNETFLAVLSCGGMQTICTMRWPVAEAKNSRPDGRDFHVERVTHWMPLPAAPSPTEKENP